MKTSQAIALSVVLWVLGVGAVLADAQLSAGKYQAQISPSVDPQAANSIEKSLNNIHEIGAIKVNSSDSSVHFRVNEGRQVDLARLDAAIKAADPNVTLTLPIPTDAQTSDASASGDYNGKPESGNFGHPPSANTKNSAD